MIYHNAFTRDKRPGSVVIKGYEGDTLVWPGKKVLYYPNETGMHGTCQRSNTFGNPLECEIVKITPKRVVIKLTDANLSPLNQGKQITVVPYRLSSIRGYLG